MTTEDSRLSGEPVHLEGSVGGSSRDRVMIFLESFGAGGAESVLIAVANDLYRRGTAVELVLVRACGPNRRRLAEGIPVIELSASRTVLAVPELSRYITSKTPTVCLSALTHANLVLLMAAVRLRRPPRVFVSERRSLHSEFLESGIMKRTVKRFLISRLYARATGVIAVSNGIKDELKSLFPRSQIPVFVIFNPLDVSRLQKLSLAKDVMCLTDKDTPTVVSVGRLVPQKNLLLLISAFAVLKRERSARLVIVGEGPDRAELEEHAKSVSVLDDVVFAGYLENPYRLMREADVLAMSSDFEGLPNVLLEGLALGCNIVSTDCPTGPSEILQSGKYGRLVPIGDKQAMVEALDEALDEPREYDVSEAVRPFEMQTALMAYRQFLLEAG